MISSAHDEESMGADAGDRTSAGAADQLQPSTRRDSMILRLAGLGLAWLLRLYAGTLRLRWEGDEHQLAATERGACIYALWHGDQLPLLVPFRGSSRAILISQSRDGTLLNVVARQLGYATVRGSSSRGGSWALSALEAALRSGQSVALAVDGPRGPRHRAKSGVIKLAARTGAPILPVGLAGTGIRLRSWDGFFLPLPFSKLVIRRGYPIVSTPADENWATVDAGCRTLESALISLREVEPSDVPLRCGRLITGDHPTPTGALWPQAYVVLTRCLEPLLACIWLLISRIKRGWRATSLERLGWYDARSHSNGIWFHASSVGEAGIARSLVSALALEQGRAPCVMTTTALHARRLGEHMGVFTTRLAPFDLPGATQRAISQIRPRVLLLIETELWPGLLWTARRNNVTVIIVNGRLSDRSFRQYLRFRALFAAVLEPVIVLARTRVDARRFRALGVRADNCRVPGDFKLLARPAEPDRLPVALKQWLSAGPVLILACTHPEEECGLESVLEQLAGRLPSLKVVLVPRYPDRHGFTEGALRGAVLRSSLTGDSTIDSSVRRLLVDSIGELASLFAFAFAAVIGGSFAPRGGHNLLEAAEAGCVCIYGPSTQGIAEQVSLLEAVNAGIRIDDIAQLCRVIPDLLSDPERVCVWGRAGQTVVRKARRQLEGELHHLRELIPVKTTESS